LKIRLTQMVYISLDLATISRDIRSISRPLSSQRLVRPLFPWSSAELMMVWSLTWKPPSNTEFKPNLFTKSTRIMALKKSLSLQELYLMLLVISLPSILPINSLLRDQTFNREWKSNCKKECLNLHGMRSSSSNLDPSRFPIYLNRKFKTLRLRVKISIKPTLN